MTPIAATLVPQNSENKHQGLFLVKGPFRKIFLGDGGLYSGGAYIWTNICVLKMLFVQEIVNF